MLKKLFSAVLIICAFCCYPAAGRHQLSAAEAEDRQDAVLESLIAQALKDNPQISAAAERINAAEYEVSAAKAKMLPSAVAAGAGLWQRDGLKAQIPLPSLGGINIPIMHNYTYGAALMLNQIIYSGGSLQAKKQAAALAVDAEKAAAIRTGQGVAHAVRTAYYALRSAQAKNLVAEKALNLARHHYNHAEKLFKAGVVAKNDTLRGKVAVAEAELNKIRAENGIALAKEGLIRAIGDNPNADLAEKRSLETIFAANNYFTYKVNNEDINEAFEKREELKVYSTLSKKAEKLAKAAHGQTLPQILASVGYVAIGHEFFPSDTSEPIAAIGISWKFYDSGEMRAKTSEAKAKARELLLLLENEKNGVRMEVRQAQLSIESALSRLEVAKRQLEHSREDYRIASRRYEENVGTNLDMIDARVALINSMSEVVTAIYDIKTAESNLTFAIGR